MGMNGNIYISFLDIEDSIKQFKDLVNRIIFHNNLPHTTTRKKSLSKGKGLFAHASILVLD